MKHKPSDRLEEIIRKGKKKIVDEVVTSQMEQTGLVWGMEAHHQSWGDSMTKFNQMSVELRDKAIKRISKTVESSIRQAVESALKSERENYKDLEHLLYFVAGCYQVNFEKFRPAHDNPEWKHKAFMQFSTVQGSENRESVELLSKQPYEQERIKRAIEAQLKKHKEVLEKK